MDLAAAEAAGIRDAAGRAGLLEYLESRGFSLAEMVEAEEQGRLFALAGDAVIRSGPSRHSLRTAAEATLRAKQVEDLGLGGDQGLAVVLENVA